MAWSNPKKSVDLVKQNVEASHLQYLSDINRIEKQLQDEKNRGVVTFGTSILLSHAKKESMRTDKQRADEEKERQREFASRADKIVLWTIENADIGPTHYQVDKEEVITDGDDEIEIEIDLQKVRIVLKRLGYKKSVRSINKSSFDVKVEKEYGYNPNNCYFFS